MDNEIAELEISKVNNFWVFCCGMFRSGSTLQYQLTSGLVEKLNIGVRSKYLSESEFPQLLTEYKSTTGFTVLKAHFITPPMQILLDCGKARSIGCYRDIRDVAVSMIKMWDLSFDDLMKQRRLEQAIDGLNEWSQHPGHMVSKYEEMILQPSNEIMRIASHLNIHCEDAVAKEIAKEYSLKKQLARVETIAKRKSALGIQGAYWDPHSLLHANHINSGSMGAWETVLTREQVLILESKFRDWLLGKGYSLFS